MTGINQKSKVEPPHGLGAESIQARKNLSAFEITHISSIPSLNTTVNVEVVHMASSKLAIMTNRELFTNADRPNVIRFRKHLGWFVRKMRSL
ncbi:hypothetical protein RRG08_045824 [Elysia crispata]|uniref:Uncharacterized protein n=1 Tax=Elysia crispata TaxID=231223 RepID=A0AAE1D7F4_9GAST|nr:hypothetical protein RRG08_045824 [Elysia crispata]